MKPTVLILAGGANSRFFPFNTITHKCGIELLGQTLLERTLLNLKAHDFSKVVIVVGPKDTDGHGLSGDARYQALGLEITWVTQPQAKGMGDAVLLAKDHLGEQAAVVSPYHFHAGEALDALLALNCPNAVCYDTTDKPWLYGILNLENDVVKGIVEKPAPGTEPSSFRNLTLHLIDQQFLALLSEQPEEEYNFESALDRLAHQATVKAIHVPTPIIPLKFAWDLFSFSSELLSNQTSSRHPSAQIADTAVLDESHGPIVIAEGAKIGDFAKIVGPAYIGQNALVGDYSFVRHSSIEADAQVGAKTEVVRSIIMRGATIHFSYLADSILGAGTKVGAGLITANKRLDRQPIHTHVKDNKVNTGLTAFGTIIGEHAKLGIRVSTMPGVMIGANAQVMPHQLVTKNIGHTITQ